MRLDKYLSEAGIGTRTELKKGIRKGFATVNGVVADRPETKVDEHDTVTWKGMTVAYASLEYIMLNKPAGVVSATEDYRDTTVIDIVESIRNDLFPVGRLDKDTEGLLILTNDGALSHRLLSPKRHVDKVYEADVDGVMTEEDVAVFAEGFVVDEELTAKPAKLEIMSVEDDRCHIRLTLHEGKFHQVKRMVAARGCEVTYLKRVSMGKLVLDPSLLPGDYRDLTSEEVLALYES